MNDHFGDIPIVVSPYAPPGTIYLLGPSVFNFDLPDDFEIKPESRKHWIIQAWLDGILTTDAAVALALASRDPEAYVWAQAVLSSQIIDPKDMVRITGV